MIVQTIGRLTLWLNEKSARICADLSALTLRVSLGLFMALGHGWGKLTTFSEKAETWADPIGLGSATSLALAIGAEVFCSLAIVFGIATRLSLVPLIFTMIVAGFIVHGSDPFGTKEKALLFLVGYLALLFIGPGRFSIDHLITRKLIDRGNTSSE